MKAPPPPTAAPPPVKAPPPPAAAPAPMKIPPAPTGGPRPLRATGAPLYRGPPQSSVGMQRAPKPPAVMHQPPRGPSTAMSMPPRAPPNASVGVQGMPQPATVSYQPLKGPPLSSTHQAPQGNTNRTMPSPIMRRSAPNTPKSPERSILRTSVLLESMEEGEMETRIDGSRGHSFLVQTTMSEKETALVGRPTTLLPASELKKYQDSQKEKEKKR